MENKKFFGKDLTCTESPTIPGLLVFDIPVHDDPRGWFKENFQKEKMVELGFPEGFFNGRLQNNVSYSTRDVIRGMHAEPWDKFVSVADQGEVLGMWVDLREGDTFGNVYTHVIDASVGIYIPKGVANGFQVLTDFVAYSYLVNDYWSLDLKPEYGFVNYADPTLNLPWPNLPGALVSEADESHPLLADAKRF